MSDESPSLISAPAYVAWYGRGRKQNWTTPRKIFDPLNDEYAVHRALELGAEARFFLGRPSFGSGPDGQKGHNSPVDCLFLVFDARAQRGAIRVAA